MIKKHIGAPHGKPARKSIPNLNTHKRKNLQYVIAASTTKEKNKDVVIKFKPIVKKLGKNYIEITQLTDFEPAVLTVSPTLKIHQVSPRMLKFAKFLKRTPIASIRRMGYDIVDI